MQAGRLRHRCTLQQKQRNADGMGGGLETWTERRSLWAEIAIPTGRVATVAQQLEATVTAEIRVRLAADIRAGMRLVHGGTTYAIEAVLPDNDRTLLRLLCSSVAHP